MIIWDIFTFLLTFMGLLFFTAGTVGLLRFPDVFSRLHALTKADNLGLGMITIGLLPQIGSLFDGIQLIIIWVFVMFSGAVGGFIVANFGLANRKTVFKTKPHALPGDGHEY